MKHAAPSVLASVALLAAACVDSSLPSGDSIVSPSVWNTHPGKVQTFVAQDPNAPGAAFTWTVPLGLTPLAQTPDSITLLSTLALGNYALQAESNAGTGTLGQAEVGVVDFSFSFKLAQGYTGDAAHEPLGDVAVVQATTPAPLGTAWVAYANPSTGEGFVKLYQSNFLTEVPGSSFPAVFDLQHPPQIAVDGQGIAYWIESPNGQTFTLRRADAGGLLSPLALNGFLGLTPLLGTDMAASDDGDLYFECLTVTGSLGLFHFTDVFGAAPAASLVIDSSPFTDARLAIDPQDRILLADNEAGDLLRITEGVLPPENLGNFIDTFADVDADLEGAIYLCTIKEVIVLDTLGGVVLTLQQAQVPDINGQPVNVPFELLLGCGVTGKGNLRVVDGALTNIPNLPIGTTATRNFAIDLQ